MTGFVLGAITASIVAFYVEKYQRRRRSVRYREINPSDYGNQLRFLKEVVLEKWRPINKEAYKVYHAIERLLQEKPVTYRLLAETSMGAFLRVAKYSGTYEQVSRARSAFNSKRIDFLIIDNYGNVALAIEYHGTGHYQGNAEARDAVKKLALEMADIEFMEIFPDSDPEEYLADISLFLDSYMANRE